MVKKDVGQGAVLGFDWTKDAGGWGRNADGRDEVKKQDYSKDKKSKGTPSIHATEGSHKGCKVLLMRTGPVILVGLDSLRD